MATQANAAGAALDDRATSFVELMNELGDSRGHIASAIIASNGGVLYQSITARVHNYNMSTLMGVSRDLFGKARSMTQKSGFDSCDEMTIQTDNEVLVIRSAEKECLVGVTLFARIEKQRLLQAILPHMPPALYQLG